MNNKLYMIHFFRGIASILVVLHHLTGYLRENFDYSFMNNYFDSGWVGVDFFFVLSGFIIFYIHEKDIGNPSAVKLFLLKRFIRIFPTYWVATLLFFPIFLLITPTIKIDNIIYSFLLLPQKEMPVLNVGWSLTYEVFFYLIFALVIMTKNKFNRNLFITVWLIGIVLLLNNNSNNNGNFYLNFIFSGYSLEFIVGCLAAYIANNSKKKFSNNYLYIGVLFFIFSYFLVHNEIFTKFSVLRILCFSSASFLIILGSSSIKVSIPKYIFKVMNYLGDASYSIYLVHLPLIIVTSQIFIKVYPKLLEYQLGYSLTILIATLFGSFIFYSFVERKINLKINKKIILYYSDSKSKKSA